MAKSEEEYRSKRGLSRITTGLDDFDYRIVTEMARNRNLPHSEVVRIIVHQYIESFPDKLKLHYGVDINEVREELKLESAEIFIDKTLKPYEKEIIKDLPEFFNSVSDASIDDLADYYNVNTKAIKRLFFTHGKNIKSIGLDLILKEGRIYKATN